MILLLLPSKGWDYRHVPSCPGLCGNGEQSPGSILSKHSTNWVPVQPPQLHLDSILHSGHYLNSVSEKNLSTSKTCPYKSIIKNIKKKASFYFCSRWWLSQKLTTQAQRTRDYGLFSPNRRSSVSGPSTAVQRTQKKDGETVRARAGEECCRTMSSQHHSCGTHGLMQRWLPSEDLPETRTENTPAPTAEASWGPSLTES